MSPRIAVGDGAPVARVGHGELRRGRFCMREWQPVERALGLLQVIIMLLFMMMVMMMSRSESLDCCRRRYLSCEYQMPSAETQLCVHAWMASRQVSPWFVARDIVPVSSWIVAADSATVAGVARYELQCL